MYPYYFIDTDFFKLNLYGLLMFIGIIGALIVFDVYTTKRGMRASSQRFFILAIVVSIAAGIGSSMLFQSFYDFIESGFQEWNWNSGMTFLGGLIGGVVTFLLIFLVGNKIKKGKYSKDLVMISEVLACGVTIAHFFGRLGCFTAGCCYGKETSSVFGMHFPYLEGYQGAITPDLRVHPTQLYEAFALLVLFCICTWLFFRHSKFSLPTYLAGYGLARFVLEYFRDDPRGELVGTALSPSQQITLAMMIAGFIWLIVLVVLEIMRRKNKVEISAFTVETLVRNLPASPTAEEGAADGIETCAPVGEISSGSIDNEAQNIRLFTYRKENAFFTVSECGGALYAYGADGADWVSKGINDPPGLIGLPYVKDWVEGAKWHVRQIADGMKLTRAFTLDGEEQGKLSASVTMTLDDGGALRIDCRARTEVDTMCGLFPFMLLEANDFTHADGVWTARSPLGELTIETAPEGVHSEQVGGVYSLDCRHVEELRKGEEYVRTLTLRFVPNQQENAEVRTDPAKESDAGELARE